MDICKGGGFRNPWNPLLATLLVSADKQLSQKTQPTQPLQQQLQQLLDKLKQQLPTNLSYTVTTIADRQADKTSDQARDKHQQKLARLQHNMMRQKMTKNRPQLG